MQRKSIYGFTATHLTILASVAIMAPCTVYGVASYQNVAIEDVTAGYHAGVDSRSRLQVYDPSVDPLIGYANNPLNFVRAYASCNSGNSGATVYTPPSGKALIVKSTTLSFYSGTSGSDNYAYLYGDSIFVGGVESANVADDHTSELGNGLYVSGAVTLTCASTGTYLATVTGYLVPSSFIPPAAAGQSARTGPHFTKAGKEY